MNEKETKNFPDKLPGPEYKIKIDWFYSFMLFCGPCGFIYGFWVVEKPLLTSIYSEF